MQLDFARKLVLAGDEDVLSTEDLLALLLGSTDAAREVIGRYETLGALEEATVLELQGLPAVGPRRAAVMRAALALARRRGSEPPLRGRQIGSSEDVYELIFPLLRHEKREILVVLALDSRNRLLRSPITITVGSLTRAALEPRDLLRPLIIAAAAAAIVSHNHPSTCPEPSGDDIALSRMTFEACAMIGIRFLDHVIIGDGSYVSLADRGLL